MALKITDECIACGACVPECPTNSITEGTPYVIDACHLRGVRRSFRYPAMPGGLSGCRYSHPQGITRHKYHQPGAENPPLAI